MANKYQKEESIKTDKVSSEYVQNAPPQAVWKDFDHFWRSAIKNGSPLIKESLKAHITALGWINKPERYIESALHFGIEIEKDKKSK